MIVLISHVDESRELYKNPITLCNGSLVNAEMVAFRGDSLSAHGLGGSQSSFSTGYFCRYCYSCYGKVSNTFLENQFCLRSIESFAEDINEALQSRGGRGVKHRFALHELGYNAI